MKKSVLSVIVYGIISLIASSSQAQTSTNVEALKKISDNESSAFSIRKTEALNFTRRNNLPASFETPDRRFAEIQGIDDLGRPWYYITDNANSAKTVSTNQVYAGGNAGLNLTGAGITVRIWDAGAVRLSHQEFGGRVVQGDGITTLNFHSTHVAGTMIASGVDAAAKGMAPEAQLRAFDWNNDASEVAAEGANGALISNHSYGCIRGWTFAGYWVWYGNPAISTQEDYLFGFYDSGAQLWDNIARNAPYYLICRSAGNDRNEGPIGGAYPKDGPYDCIGQAGISKNILTVGAVNDIPNGYSGPSCVVMTSYSCWGPADDGRIKPDIVANGAGLYSTDMDNDADYTTLSGTSMSSPSVAGSLALLQQHWNNLHPGTYMLAATLKGLIINTADEAGPSDGPDYQFGWGLMNTKNAALKISEDQTNDVIDELVLNNGGTFTKTIESDGTQPIKVTICWTDIPGTPVSPQLDPITPMLVNDLDLRLTYSTSTYYPWKLDPANPANPATNNSKNNVDNVEEVYIATPAAGTYTIVVDHDGTLSGGSQAFSLIISGATSSDTNPDPNPPSCTAPISPAGGATNVPISSSLSWEEASGATGYIIYFGTNNPPTSIENGTDLGNVTTYSPSPAMNYSQTYYWKIVPYNNDGQATGCSIWSFTTESNPYITLPYTENFESGFGQWQQSTDDDFDWTNIVGDTPTPKTSPKKAHNGSHYIYTEASRPQGPGYEASIEATFSFSGIPNPELSLWYHLYGNQMGTLHVDVYNGSWNYNVWSLSGQQQTSDKQAYRNAIIGLSQFGNQTGIKLRLRGTIGSGERSDICIDLVSVKQQDGYGPGDPLPVISEENINKEMEQPVLENVFDRTEIYSFNHSIFIRNNDEENIIGQVNIFNTMGQILKVIDIDGSNFYQLDADLKPGIYIIRLTSDNNLVSRVIPIF
jgi:hypothetical protein